MADQVGVIYCGSCGALNPRTNHYCSACGHQLVDAYHPSEGLRVYQTPDPGAPLVEIVDPGVGLTVVETEEALPADFAKVLIEDGRVGYVRLREVEQAAGGTAGTAPARRTQLGCISSTAVLAIIALMLVAALLFLALAFSSDDPTADFIAILACVTVVPFLFVVVGFYLYVQKREAELLGDDEDEPASDVMPDAGQRAAESSSD
jgi:hypothetical protein